MMILALTMMAMQPATTQASTVDEQCEGIGRMAQAVMKARQSNVPMSSMMKKIREITPESLLAVGQQMVRSAYDRPSYYTPEAKAEEVVRFRNDWETDCYKAAK